MTAAPRPLLVNVAAGWLGDFDFDIDPAWPGEGEEMSDVKLYREGLDRLDPRSRGRLQEVNPHLVAVVALAVLCSDLAFMVTEGLRTVQRQRELVAKGASTTLRSRHLTGHAVDLAVMIDFDGDGRLDVRWDWPLYDRLAATMKAAAAELNIDGLEWGGDWETFRDGPHFQLSWERYPL